MPITMAADDFDRLVDQAISGIPERLAELIDNVVIMVEDLPSAQDRGLLGYYDGVPLTERDTTYAGVLPDRIVIFREPILDICTSPADVVEQVRITVVHEIAHHFGIDDDHLDELGYA
jgi:predicted Zn-dependent protease with MMP-like domain